MAQLQLTVLVPSKNKSEGAYIRLTRIDLDLLVWPGSLDERHTRAVPKENWSAVRTIVFSQPSPVSICD